jgi:hypothetical protein
MKWLVLFIATDACRAHLEGCGAIIAVLHSPHNVSMSRTPC